MNWNDQLKQLLLRPYTDEELLKKELQEFEFTIRKVYNSLSNSRDEIITYKFNPIYRLSLDSEVFKNKALLKKFTDMVDLEGFRHEFNAPQNAYCIYINQK